MDPVSRRLAAAAMVLAFGLSRDEELEKTRLDLERARMEREDFRNGAGPCTAFMHYTVDRPYWTNYEACYKDRMTAETSTMRKHDKDSEKLYGGLSEGFNKMSRDLVSARTLLAKVVLENITKRRKLSEPTVNGIVQHFRKADFDDDDVEEYANDDLGEVSIGLSVSTDEDSGSLTTSDE